MSMLVRHGTPQPQNEEFPGGRKIENSARSSLNWWGLLLVSLQCPSRFHPGTHDRKAAGRNDDRRATPSPIRGRSGWAGSDGTLRPTADPGTKLEAERRGEGRPSWSFRSAVPF